MDPTAFLARYNPIAVYHFTDYLNMPSIRKYGILSQNELCEQLVGVYRFGGNDQSRNLDSNKGLWDYAHLCFTGHHPMAYITQKDGRIDTLTYIKIKPEILLCPGVMGCSTVANKHGSEIQPIDQILDRINFEAIYSSHPDFKDPEFDKGRRAEILVPKGIAPQFILNF